MYLIYLAMDHGLPEKRTKYKRSSLFSFRFDCEENKLCKMET
jgi:hypothetical protein